MEHYVEKHPQWGQMLWLKGCGAQMGIPLEYGIRILHASCEGMENLLYEQPADLSDGFVTEEGWVLRGGHRLWPSPEGPESTQPDNDPIEWKVEGDTVALVQKDDPVTGWRKELDITFRPDGILLTHRYRNISQTDKVCASWGISTMAPGGKAYVDFTQSQEIPLYNPRRPVSLWKDTDLGDPRLKFTRNSLTAAYLPLEEYCKLGIWCREGLCRYENRGQRLLLRFEAPPAKELPDGGCNFELYMGKYFMEVETLGRLQTLRPGQCAQHWELWQLEKL